MDLADSVENIKGIGPKTAALLQKADIKTIRDLLYLLPRDYEVYQNVTNIKDLRPGKVTVKAKVSDIKTSRKRRLTITEAQLSDETGALRAIWFNQPYRANQFSKDQEYLFAGNLEFSYGRYQITNPSAKIAADNKKQGTESSIEPIYPAKSGIKSTEYKKFIKSIQSQFYLIPNFIPDQLNFKVNNITNRADALYKIHFPNNDLESKSARDYLAIEELFTLLLASKLNKIENAKLKAEAIRYDLKEFQSFVNNLPFKLTNAQRRSTWEILQDLTRDTPMNRLLQGDVGSGKTLVAALSSLAVSQAGFQTALLAPTEILAKQHAESLANLFNNKINIALLTGSTKHKAELKKHIKNGDVNLIVGTHALLTDDTFFRNLALVIIDEQHRFGVNQRQKLLTKAHKMPHLLSMTATPIPRSLQLTIFGDLSVSILDELPKGRQPIESKIISPGLTDKMWDKVEEELTAGRQAYYICKMIDESKKEDITSVKKEFETIKRRLKNYRVAMLHGKMKSSEKDSIMQDFSAHKIDILVSTTVVEVGVDVPNSTIMIIADADKYGLSQLHQLRGRVGRGQHKSYCYFINSTSDKPSRRLREIEQSTDGFHLAEVDLKLRGPGEIYGSLQHGALDLRIATITDSKLVHQADLLAKEFIEQKINMLEYKELSVAVKKYQRLTTLN